MSYRIVKTRATNTAVFVNLEDGEALDAIRAAHGNRELVISVASYAVPDPSSPCVYSLCFHITSGSLEQARRSTLHVVYYIAENCGIPQESLDIVYNGGGIALGGGDQPAHNAKANISATAPAEMVILIPPAVFGGTPTAIMPSLNYDLARQMSAVGIENLDIDVYMREHFVPLPDSVCPATGRFAVSVGIQELLYLDAVSIFDLSKQPRGEDSLAVSCFVPKAVEWFAKALAEKDKQARRQAQLREHLLGLGWVIPPCIRHLDWAELPKDSVLETCRIVAGFYPFIGAGTDEVWYHTHRLTQRHRLKPGARIQAIAAFGNENPAFVGCNHPLLQQFCPASGCLINHLIDELKNPRLFT
jgi:hypothetical protein